MAVINTDTDTRYWKIIDIDPLPDGTFNVLAKQVKDYLGNPVDVRPAIERMLNRPQNNLAVGTIVKITDVTTTDRTFTVNPTS